MNEYEKLKKLGEEYFEDLYEMFPTTATVMGIHRFDGELDHFSNKDLKSYLGRLVKYNDQLKKIQKKHLSEKEFIDYEMLRLNIHANLRSFGKMRYWQKNPVIYTEVVMTGLYVLASRDFSTPTVRARNLISRLDDVSRVFSEAHANLIPRQTPPQFVDSAIKSLKGSNSIFSFLIPELSEKLRDKELQQKLLAAGKRAFLELEDFKNFLESFRVSASGSMQLGEKYYVDFVRSDYYLKYNLDELEKKGLRVLRRTKRELSDLARKINPKKTWQKILADAGKNKIATDDRDLLRVYEEEIARATTFIKEKDLLSLPENLKIKVIETPEFRRNVVPYISTLSPAPFDNDQTGYVIVTPTSETWRHFGYEIIVAHEAVPGHLAQRIIHNTSRQISSLRRKLCGIGMFVERKQPRQNLFDEGWAVYVEQMMAEAGYLRDDHLILNYLKMQLWRAARTIVDIRFHTRRWGVEKAVNFLVKEVGHDPQKARDEITYYSMKPTNHMCYLIGKLELLRLREKALEKNMSLKDFHDAILSYGSIPFGLIEKALFKI